MREGIIYQRNIKITVLTKSTAPYQFFLVNPASSIILTKRISKRSNFFFKKKKYMGGLNHRNHSMPI